MDEQYLLAYRQIPILLLKNLFGVSLGEPKRAPTLERLIVLWNQIEEAYNRGLGKAGEAAPHTFYYAETTPSGAVITHDVRAGVGQLREIRNQQVHSSKIDPKQVEYAVGLAERLLSALTGKHENP